MIFELSFDDNCIENLKLLNLLNKLGFKATFYLQNKDIDEEFVKMLLAEGHELGCHSFEHPQDMKTLSFPGKFRNTYTSKKDLEQRFKIIVNKYCYPRGRFDDDIVRLLKEYGFTEGRTTLVLKTDTDFDPFKKPTTIHWYQRSEYRGKPILEMAIKKFQEAKNKENGYFHLWAHGWELTRDGNWDTLEEFLQYVKQDFEEMSELPKGNSDISLSDKTK